jgi:hypothetical protein
VSQGIASNADAEIILKLYELRTEAVMRQARAWVTWEFWPETADEFFAVYSDISLEKNHWLRQVVSYWEMASAIVLRGALNSDLFVDCNNEPFFVLAKMMPILPAIQAKVPDYFVQTQRLVTAFPVAAARFAQMQVRAAARRAARKTG